MQREPFVFSTKCDEAEVVSGADQVRSDPSVHEGNKMATRWAVRAERSKGQGAGHGSRVGAASQGVVAAISLLPDVTAGPRTDLPRVLAVTHHTRGHRERLSGFSSIAYKTNKEPT